MNIWINPQKFTGIVRIPASKSHTIRQLLIASLANGTSEILFPLDSLDTRSCIAACRVFGAKIDEHYEIDDTCSNPADPQGKKLVKLTVDGNANFTKRHSEPTSPSPTSNIQPLTSKIDVGNSGTTLYLALALAGLQTQPIQFTGDEQIQKRSAAPLLDALAGVGVKCQSNDGCAPITVQGPWAGGKVVLPCPTSQYLSAMLIAAPLAPAGTVTEIEVPLLNELPYIEMTLSYLKEQGVSIEANFSGSSPLPTNSNSVLQKTPVPTSSGHFVIHGGYPYKPFASSVPADFSSAAFPAAAAAITGGPVTLLGLDPQDTQGDKFFLEMLRKMGCEVSWTSSESSSVPQTPVPNGYRLASDLQSPVPTVTISRSAPLKGGTFDLNETPDLLPAAAAVTAYAQGDTALTNVAHARIKETDRIAVMAQELAKLGVKCTEKEDGLIIHGKGGLPLVPSGYRHASDPRSPLPILEGHGDHRIVMALAVAALGCANPVEITGAEAANVTYPGFLSLFAV